MAYHEVAMWEILNVLERLARRETKAAITRATGRSRSTIRRYEREARQLGWAPGSPWLTSFRNASSDRGITSNRLAYSLPDLARGLTVAALCGLLVRFPPRSEIAIHQLPRHTDR